MKSFLLDCDFHQCAIELSSKERNTGYNGDLSAIAVESLHNECASLLLAIFFFDHKNERSLETLHHFFANVKVDFLDFTDHIFQTNVIYIREFWAHTSASNSLLFDQVHFAELFN